MSNRLLIAASNDSAARRTRDLLGRDAAASNACSLADFDSDSPAMRESMALARAAARSHSTVLISGETGVGKERLARALHAAGPRADQPFVAVNSGAITESLAESELFGHERGAFTGAERTRRGLFELAHRGTLFLDEISEMPPALQVKLLRAVEEGAIRRVGSEQPLAVDVRLIAATNGDLHAELRAGRFRPDLYFRLAVVSLSLPPLRERREDLPEMIDRCLRIVCARLARPVPAVRDDACRALAAHGWPGNVRELQNVLERAVLMSDGRTITAGELPREFEYTLDHRPASPVESPTDLPVAGANGGAPPWRGRPMLDVRSELVARFERAYLVDALQISGGRTGEAARRAGVSTRSMSDMLKRHGLRRKDYWTATTREAQ